MKEEIKLSDHFGYRKLMRFTMPSIVMLIFTSIYGVVDGLFVSNFVGKTSFAAVNLIMPVLMILGCVGFMFGTGGGALIAMSLGEGKKEKASHIFSFIVAFSAICGIVLGLLGIILIRPVAMMLGAEGKYYMEELFLRHYLFIYCSLSFSVCLQQRESLSLVCM